MLHSLVVGSMARKRDRGEEEEDPHKPKNHMFLSPGQA